MSSGVKGLQFLRIFNVFGLSCAIMVTMGLYYSQIIESPYIKYSVIFILGISIIYLLKVLQQNTFNIWEQRIQDISENKFSILANWQFDVTNPTWMNYKKITLERLRKKRKRFYIFFITWLGISFLTLFFYYETAVLSIWFNGLFYFNYYFIGRKYGSNLLEKSIRSNKPSIVISNMGILISDLFYIALNDDMIYTDDITIVTYNSFENYVRFRINVVDLESSSDSNTYEYIPFPVNKLEEVKKLQRSFNR